VSDLGEGYFLVPLNLFLFSILHPYRPRLAVLLPAMTLGSVAVEVMGKWLVSRPRPNLVAYGFPSGHVFVAVVFFGGLFYVVTVMERRRRWRLFNAAVSGTLLLGVAYSRLYLNAHWLTDVLAGFAGGGAYLLTVLALVDGWARGADVSSG
jgi:undecaprenyl-diphosphatase